MRTFGRPKTSVETTCPICGSVFEAFKSEIRRGSGRYCSQICADEAKRRNVTAHVAEVPRAPKVELKCSTCGKTFFVYPYRASLARPASFCSKECRLTRPAYRQRSP